MRLIIVGCEYSGTTTLTTEVCRWAERVMGGNFCFHDHWKIPHFAFDAQNHATVTLTEAEQKEVLALSHTTKEMIGRYNIAYHMPTDYEGPDYIMVGFYMDDTVYAPLYFGYGGEDEIQGGPRTEYSRHLEMSILGTLPDVVLVLLKASPEVIARRMKANPHQNGALQEKDIEYVLQRFDEEYERSVIGRKFTLDTSTATVEETLEQFVKQIEPHLSEADWLRVHTHRSLQRG